MKTNNEQGRVITIGIAVYLVFKVVLNGVLGGGLALGELLLAILFGAVMLTGGKFANYVIAGFLALVAISHLPDNISNIGSNWIYLLEGIVDIGCGAVLCFFAPVKEHFTNDWQDLFSK